MTKMIVAQGGLDVYDGGHRRLAKKKVKGPAQAKLGRAPSRIGVDAKSGSPVFHLSAMN
jgi:hypothetical protein